jgi:DNA replication and repair protein RecF
VSTGAGVKLERLWLADFRNYRRAEIAFTPGVTVILGSNGEGKTNLLEAIDYLATLSSFRGAPTDALVRAGASTAVVRAEGEREGRALLIEAEIAGGGRGTVLVNRQRLPRRGDLLGALRATVFSPDDLAIVKGGPALRRRFVDDLLVAVDPRLQALRSELERIIRQRNALLRQARGRLTDDVVTTLEVWDTKLVEAGETLADRRADVLDRLLPFVGKAYGDVAGSPADLQITYEAPWRATGLEAALGAARADELRRGVSLVGPHRDEVAVSLSALPARTHASQGEQRCLALALRLGSHRLVTEAVGTPPVLLLDDIFSELDPARSEALLAHLPAGQVILTAAVAPPPGSEPDQVLRVHQGSVTLGAGPL